MKKISYLILVLFLSFTSFFIAKELGANPSNNLQGNTIQNLRTDTVHFNSSMINNGWKWLSFPSLDILNANGDSALNVLSDILDYQIIDYAKTQTYQIRWIILNWQNANQIFSRTEGIKIRTIAEAEAHISGVKIPDDTTISLTGNNSENWVGYWLDDTQKLEDAFGHWFTDGNITSIQAQHWSANKFMERWLIKTKNGQNPTLSYGDMVIIKCTNSISDFGWDNSTAPDPKVIFRTPKQFTYQEQSSYSTIYIELDSTNLPKEIGLYVDDICLGAAVVEDTLVQVCTYSNGKKGDIELEFYYGEHIPNKRIKHYKYISLNSLDKEKKIISLSHNSGSYYINLKE